MKFSSIAAIAALSVAAISTSAQAADWVFSFSGSDAFSPQSTVSGSGRITTSDAGSPFTVLAISGTVSDSAVDAGGPFTITGLDGSYGGPSNLLYYPSQPFVDFGGISFTTDTGGVFNLGLGGGGTYGYVLNSSVINPGGGCCTAGSTDINLHVAGVPEPATWGLMISGFGLAGAALRRRRAAVATVAA